MFTRIAQRKRPRRPAYVFMVAGSVAAILVASVALALISDTGTFDVTVASSATSKTADLGNASVEYIGSSASNQSSGTGLFDPFVRLQGSPTEAGYNTCSQTSCGGDVTEFDTKTGTWTHAILASAIPVVDCGGDLVGTNCWELFNDINEGNSTKYVSLNEVEVWLTTNARITGYNATTGFAGATQIYDFTGSILIHDVNQGSGRGDLRYLIPVQPFNAGDYFVLYSKWGTTAGDAPDGKTWGSEGGFEEWKVRKAPSVTIVKTADAASVNAGANIGFTVTVTNGGAADATGVTVNDPLPNTAGSGVDWSITSQSPTGSCSITGSPPTETLTCGPLTLAAGGGSLTVHVQSGTSGASCGTYTNTATFTSTNAGTGFDTASTTVNCAAILILKNSSKLVGGVPVRVSNAGAVFSITGPGSYSNSVTDSDTTGTEDEDASVGEICISGLAPGSYTVTETTPPAGYTGSGSGTAVATAGTNCTDNQPSGTDVLTLTNNPTYDIQVNFRDGGSGDTSATISCTNVTEDSTTPPAGWDTSSTSTGETFIGNVVCTITVDP